MFLFFFIMFIIFVTALIIFIKLYYQSMTSNKIIHKLSKYEWVSLDVALVSFILALCGLGTINASRPSGQHITQTAQTSQKAKEPKTYLQVDGQQVKKDTQRDKTFANGNLSYDIHTNKNTQLHFDPTISHKSAHLVKVGPNHYQVKMMFNTDDSSTDNISGNQGYTETLTAKSKGHRSTDVDLGANDTKDEAEQVTKSHNELMEQEKAKTRQKKERAQAKLNTKYPTLDASSLVGQTNDQLGNIKYFRVDGRVMSVGESDSDDTQVIFKVKGSDRPFFMSISNHMALKQHIDTPDLITVYGAYIDNQEEVTDSMVDHNAIDPDLLGDQLYTVEAPERVIDHINPGEN